MSAIGSDVFMFGVALLGGGSRHAPRVRGACR
jgi:hypothetical protein